MGPAVAAYPGDLGSRPGPRWIPARPSTSALHVRVHGARARWRAPPCLSVLLLLLLPLLPPPLLLPLPPPPPPRRGKGAGNRVSRGRGPERHGPEGVRKAAGLPRASPPRESRLDSAGAGRAHGEAGPRPLSYGHQVRGPRGTDWGLVREGQGATGGVGEGHLSRRGRGWRRRDAGGSRGRQGKEVPGPSLLSWPPPLPASSLSLSPEPGLPLTAWEM